MKYVAIILYTEGQYGDEIHDVFGPFDTRQQAHDSAMAFIDKQDERTDFSEVYSYEVKPLRSHDTAENFHTSLEWLYLRTDKFYRMDDNDRTWP